MRDAQGLWLGWAKGDRGAEVVNIKNWLRPRFSYAKTLDSSDLFDDTLDAVTREAQRRLSLPVNGIWDWALQVKIGYKKPAPPVTTCFIIPGTWAGPLDGPPAWVMDWVDKTRYRRLDIWYLAMGFLTPDPNVSYEESLLDGIEKTIQGILVTPGPIVLIGYSQGSDVAVHVMQEFEPGRRLAHRRGDLKRVICFGNPGRPPGPDFTGKRFAGAGISGVYPPAGLANLLHSYDFEQDMYANANQIMREFYSILTKMELSVPFFMAVLQLIGGAVGGFGGIGNGGVLLGSLMTGLFGNTGGDLTKRLLAVAPMATQQQALSITGILSDLPGVAFALQQLMGFISTNAHTRYGGSEAWLDYGGTDAVRHAAFDLNNTRF